MTNLDRYNIESMTSRDARAIFIRRKRRRRCNVVTRVTMHWVSSILVILTLQSHLFHNHIGDDMRLFEFHDSGNHEITKRRSIDLNIQSAML